MYKPPGRCTIEKTPPRLDGVKFGRRRHKIANVPPDGSCRDSRNTTFGRCDH